MVGAERQKEEPEMKYEDCGMQLVVTKQDAEPEYRKTYRVLDENGCTRGYVVRVDSKVTHHRYWLYQAGEWFYLADNTPYIIPLVGFRGAVSSTRQDATDKMLSIGKALCA